jgi:hypothetical protein
LQSNPHDVELKAGDGAHRRPFSASWPVANVSRVRTARGSLVRTGVLLETHYRLPVGRQHGNAGPSGRCWPRKP